MKLKSTVSVFVAVACVAGGCMFHIEEAFDLGHYTMEGRRAVSHAVQSVARTRGDVITPEHLVLGLLEADVRASQYIRAAGTDPVTLQSRITELLPRVKGKSRPSTYPMDERTKAILRAAYEEPKAEGRKMTSVDILIGVLSDGDSAAARVLTASGLAVADIRRAFTADAERDKWASE